MRLATWPASTCDMPHVPYRGDTPALTDLRGGQVQVYFSTLSGSIEYISPSALVVLSLMTQIEVARKSHRSRCLASFRGGCGRNRMERAATAH